MARRLAPVFTSFLATALLPAPALACGMVAEPLDYFTFAAPSPAPDSVEVPRDVTLILRGQGYGIGGSPVVFSWFDVETVSVSDAGGNEVAGHLAMSEFSETSPVISWIPDGLLDAETEYRVSATLADQTQERPAEAEGAESIEFGFTTGSGVTPELALDGELGVTLDTVIVPALDCSTINDCGERNCVPNGERQALIATVTVPAVQGGTDDEGYQGLLIVTDTAPVSFDGPGGTTDSADTVFLAESMHLASGSGNELQIELPAEEAPYVPCFSLNVWDPGTRSVSASPVCLDAVMPPTPESAGGGEGGQGGATSELPPQPTPNQGGAGGVAPVGQIGVGGDPNGAQTTGGAGPSGDALGGGGGGGAGAAPTSEGDAGDGDAGAVPTSEGDAGDGDAAWVIDTATDSPTTATDSPTTATDSPTTATDSPTTATDSPANGAETQGTGAPQAEASEPQAKASAPQSSKGDSSGCSVGHPAKGQRPVFLGLLLAGALAAAARLRRRIPGTTTSV